jgi:hypothetical protein
VKRLGILAIFFFLSFSLFSANYYVDYAAGADTNNGTTTETPFKHCPGDNNATDTAAVTTLAAGDTVYFKGGVTYNGMVDWDWSGSEGNPITYDGNSAGTWGTGRAVIDGGNSYFGNFKSSGDRSYITVNYFELKDPRYNFLSDENACDYIIATNNICHGAGDDVQLDGAGFVTYGGEHWEVAYNTIYDCYNQAFILYPGSYWKIHHNDITDKCIWGIRIDTNLSNAGDCTGNEIYNNSIHDIYYYDDKGPHTDFIFLSTDGSDSIIGTKIYNNLIYNDYDFPEPGAGATAFIYISTGHAGGTIEDTEIWNNVFFNSHSYYMVELYSASATISNTKIYGNSFGGGNTPLRFYGTSGFKIDGLYLKNNAVHAGADVVMYIDDPNSNVINAEYDYNCWYSTNEGPFDGLTWAQWQTAGNDANGLFTDPQFVSLNVANWDLQLQDESPAIDQGVDLGASYNADILGVARPQEEGWDMGAYEHAGGAPPGAPFASDLVMVLSQVLMIPLVQVLLIIFGSGWLYMVVKAADKFFGG